MAYKFFLILAKLVILFVYHGFHRRNREVHTLAHVVGIIVRSLQNPNKVAQKYLKIVMARI